MSPSWRDGLAIAVQPDAVRVQRHRRGWKRRSDPPVGAPIGGATAAAACLQALDRALPPGAARAFDARVVLSNHFVRYALVPDASDLRGPVERDAAARHAMAATYGDLAGRWRVVLDTARGADDALAAAIDEDLYESLAGQLKAAGARRLHVEPLFAFALNRAARAVGGRTGWVAVVERGRIVLASVTSRGIGTLRSHRLRASAQEELPVMLEQSSVLDNADPHRTEVVVATEDGALALPADGQPFQFRLLRLDLTAAGGLGASA